MFSAAICIPLVVETYGAWGKEALEAFSMLASLLATSSSRPKSRVLSELYGRFNLHLVRANVRAILCRLSCPHQTFMPSFEFVCRFVICV